MKHWLLSRWYSEEPPPPPLRPLARLYGSIAARRRTRLSAQAQRLPVPVIVVGNVAVGGTGKTPLTIWLVEHLRLWGLRPGVISRGYGGRAPRYPYPAKPDGDPALCGDEPVLIARRTGAPVVVAPDRVAAACALHERYGVDVIVADDGLQHYRLARDLEICVVDGARGLGNGALLPAGPLREPPARLREVDLVVVNGHGWDDAALRPLHMRLRLDDALPLAGGEARPLSAFKGQRVHAVAGIGNPQRFFHTLQGLGIDTVPHAFDDHHAHTPAQLRFGDDLPVLMTEKDAVKCLAFAQPHWWMVPASAALTPADAARVQECVSRLRDPK